MDLVVGKVRRVYYSPILSAHGPLACCARLVRSAKRSQASAWQVKLDLPPLLAYAVGKLETQSGLISMNSSSAKVAANTGSSGTCSRVQTAQSPLLRQNSIAPEAAGIVANLKIESGLNPKAVGDGGKAYGIAQWHPPRQAEFRRAFGKDIRAATLTEQLEFQNHELTQGLEQKAGRLLRGARSAYEAARLFSDYCERPLNKQAEAMKRGQEAIRIAQMPHLPQGMLLAQEDKRTDRPRDVRRLNTAQPLFPSIVQQPAQAARGTEYNAQTAQKMQIELTLNGFPEGISAQARSADGQEIPVRIGYSLPNEVSV